MLILYYTRKAPIYSLISDNFRLTSKKKLAVFEISGRRGQLNFYRIGQEITVFGIKNAFGECLYFISKAWTPNQRLKPLFLIQKSKKNVNSKTAEDIAKSSKFRSDCTF